MKAELMSPGNPRWEGFLANTRHDFYHLPRYVELCARHEAGEPVALYVTSTKSSLLVPLVIREIPGGGLDAVSPYGYPAPLVSGPHDPPFASDALRAAFDVLGRRNVISAFVRGHPLMGPLPRGIGEIVLSGETVSVDLRLSADDHWNQTISGHRNQINRALRSGRSVAWDDRWESFGAFKRLYRDTMDRVAAADYYYFDDAYFDALREALGDRLRLCVVRADGAVAAAALFVETCGIVEFHLAGSDLEHRREGLTKLMLHFVRSWAKERGNVALHLGGGLGQPDDPLLKFKSGFSPRRHPYETLRVVIDPVEYVRLARRHAADAHGTLRPGYFPAYRAPVVEPE